MRSTGLFAAACALVFAITCVNAVVEAQQSTVHLRIHHVLRDADGSTAQEAATIDSQSASLPRQHHPHKAYDSSRTHGCAKVSTESFRSQVTNACAKRDGTSFNFYYQLRTGAVMRNCNCNDYNRGVQGVDLGTALDRSLSVQCFIKEGKKATELAKLFASHACSPFEF